MKGIQTWLIDHASLLVARRVLLPVIAVLVAAIVQLLGEDPLKLCELWSSNPDLSNPSSPE